MTVQPITPETVVAEKERILPNGVMECWNAVIAKHFVGKSAHFQQDEIVDSLMTRMNCPRAWVFSQHWLDVEPIYEAVGWKVTYDKPGFNESYAANFTFTKK